MKKFLSLMMFFLVACLPVLLISGCSNSDEQAVQAARSRIDEAISNIRVRVDGRPDTWGNIRVGDGTNFDEVDVDLNFASILDQLEPDDFFVARRYINRFIEDLYTDLALMFSRTDNLIIRESNVEELDNFETPPEMADIREFTIDIGRFLRTPDKSLVIDTHYGNLNITSDFFHGRTIIGTDTEDMAGMRLLFGYEEGEELGDVTVRLATKNRHNVEIHVENPGRSALITIPRDLDFMTDALGRGYNSVIFVDEHGYEQGILPRSFVDERYLYIYFNRTGSFRLHVSPSGFTTNHALFLSDRRINIPGDPGDYVTRGQFYEALMHIHWVENLHFDRPILPFDDVEDPHLELVINVGQNLRADICPRSPFVLQGLPGGEFHPNSPLRRNHMLMMLAGNIEYFGFEIDGLMPINDHHIGTPSSPDSHWYHHINYLIARGFVPHRTTAEGIANIAPHENLTVGEAREILFLLITTHHFVRPLQN